MREKVLNYLTKLAIRAAKVPASPRKPERGDLVPKVTGAGYYLYGCCRELRAGQTQAPASTYSYTFKGQPISSNASQVFMQNTYCAKNDSICLFHFLSNPVPAFTFPVTETRSGKRTSQLQCYNLVTPCMTWVFEEQLRARCAHLCPERGNEQILALREPDVQKKR